MPKREDIFQAKNEEGRESDEDDGQSANNNSLKVAFKGTMNDDGPSSRCQTLPEVQNIQMSTCKILQRKLELKVERAKKNYSQLQEENVSEQLKLLLLFWLIYSLSRRKKRSRRI